MVCIGCARIRIKKMNCSATLKVDYLRPNFTKQTLAFKLFIIVEEAKLDVRNFRDVSTN